MLIKVFCVVSMLSKLPPVVCLRGEGGGGGATGLLNKGGGSNRLHGLVTKQQAVEFPQVLPSNYYLPYNTYVWQCFILGRCSPETSKSFPKHFA